MNDELDAAHWSCDHENKKSSDGEEKTLKTDLLCLKTFALINFIKDNLKSADLKWSLFCAACNSYRFDSVVKPFPPFFLVQDDYKQIDRLREVIQLCPPLSKLLKQLETNSVPPTLLDLLYWVLIHLSEPSFKFIPKEEHRNILSEVSSIMPAALPDYIFSVTYGTRLQQKFALIALNRTTKLAFHGSRLDNFYSIVNHGLQVSYNKVAAFGPGIYLSSEMGVSLSYSPRGFTWSGSLFGSHISIVALCEVVDHPEVRSENESKRSKLNIFDLCDNQSIPGRYFIVENNDLVRVRYLLVYSNDEFESDTILESSTLLGWIKRHKMFTFVTAYVILLLAIGSSNSSLLYKYFRIFLRSFSSSERH